MVETSILSDFYNYKLFTLNYKLPYQQHKNTTMYIPEYYQMPDAAERAAFIRQYAFATLISAGDTEPAATHLPFVLDTENPDKWRLYSHLAKANPHAELLENRRALVIFQQPHAYISPKHYNKKMNVPTWNYLAVHAYGQPKILTGDASWAVLDKMIHLFEAEYAEQWNSLPNAYKQGLFDNITAFSIDIDRIDAKKKLSQNKTPEEQSRIAEALAQSQNAAEKELGEWMKK